MRVNDAGKGDAEERVNERPNKQAARGSDNTTLRGVFTTKLLLDLVDEGNLEFLVTVPLGVEEDLGLCAAPGDEGC